MFANTFKVQLRRLLKLTYRMVFLYFKEVFEPVEEPIENECGF